MRSTPLHLPFQTHNSPSRSVISWTQFSVFLSPSWDSTTSWRRRRRWDWVRTSLAGYPQVWSMPPSVALFLGPFLIRPMTDWRSSPRPCTSCWRATVSPIIELYWRRFLPSPQSRFYTLNTTRCGLHRQSNWWTTTSASPTGSSPSSLYPTRVIGYTSIIPISWWIAWKMISMIKEASSCLVASKALLLSLLYLLYVYFRYFSKCPFFTVNSCQCSFVIYLFSLFL